MKGAGTLRYLAALFRISLRSSTALRGSFLMNCAFMALNNLIMFVNWWILFHTVEHIGGWRLKECALLWGISAAGYGGTVILFNGARRLARYAMMGELDAFLTQPRHPLLQVLASHSSTSGWGDVLSGALLIWASGYAHLWSLWILAVVVVCGMAVLTACAVISQSLVFWAGDVREFANTIWEFLVAFSTYPDPIYSGMLRFALFSVLPAGFIVLLPVQVVQQPGAAGILLLLAAAVFYALLALWVFQRGLRRYESGSAMQVRF